MYQQWKVVLSRSMLNALGWTTNRKLVVIESDDWGSIRMPSLKSFFKLKEEGIDLIGKDAERYNLNDTLATATDLEFLFDILSSAVDRSGHPAVFTPMSVVANPDFPRISHSDFSQYFYEPFTETLKRYPGCDKSFDLWKEGMNKGIFLPQMHGREHLNVSAWMKVLQRRDVQTTMAFNEELWGFVPDQQKFPGVDFQAAFLIGDEDELEHHKTIIIEGLDLFEKLFGYRAEYFVPPNGQFYNELNKILAENGIRFRSAAKSKKELLGSGKSKKVFHYLGQSDSNGIRYILRNCFFEPSQHGKDWVDSCMRDIKIAFNWNKPAIISTHRVNYIGSHNSANRDQGLRQLNILLKEVTKYWPEVEFMTTPQLGALMK